MIRLEMKCHNTKLLKKAAKNSKYQAVKEILPSNQGQIKEQAKFTYSPTIKVYKKQIKTIQDTDEEPAKTIGVAEKGTNVSIKHKHKSTITISLQFIFKRFFNCRS